jgi:hypothetical protein
MTLKGVIIEVTSACTGSILPTWLSRRCNAMALYSTTWLQEK